MKTEDRRSRMGSSAGFTLVEMLLVITIIGILAAIVGQKFVGVTKDASINATRMAISNIETAIDSYEVNMTRLPDKLDDLVKSPGAAAWRGPYLKGGVDAMRDSWGVALQYTKKSETSYEIRSAGPDQQMGSGDDITNAGTEGAPENK